MSHFAEESVKLLINQNWQKSRESVIVSETANTLKLQSVLQKRKI